MTLIIFFTKEKKTSARLSSTFGYDTTTLLIHYSLLERFHFGIAPAAISGAYFIPSPPRQARGLSITHPISRVSELSGRAMTSLPGQALASSETRYCKRSSSSISTGPPDSFRADLFPPKSLTHRETAGGVTPSSRATAFMDSPCVYSRMARAFSSGGASSWNFPRELVAAGLTAVALRLQVPAVFHKLHRATSRTLAHASSPVGFDCRFQVILDLQIR